MFKEDLESNQDQNNSAGKFCLAFEARAKDRADLYTCEAQDERTEPYKAHSRHNINAQEGK